MKKSGTILYIIIAVFFFFLIGKACSDNDTSTSTSYQRPSETSYNNYIDFPTTTFTFETQTEPIITTTLPATTELTTPQNNQGTVVYVTRTGSKYHRLGCRYLRQSCYEISLAQARQMYEPCSVCNPPR